MNGTPRKDIAVLSRLAISLGCSLVINILILAALGELKADLHSNISKTIMQVWDANRGGPAIVLAEQGNDDWP